MAKDKKPVKDEGQFMDAYEQYADAIFRHCYFRVFDRDLAFDLMQETFTRTWNYMQKGNTIEDIRAFLYRVANNCIIDHSRKKKATSLDDLQEKGFDPRLQDKETLPERIDAKGVVALLDQLDAKYRDVIIMRYIDELSPREIASILEESENAVSVRLHRALAKARTLLNYEY